MDQKMLVKNSVNILEKMAIDGGFDYLYFLGCDTIAPDVIEILKKYCWFIGEGPRE